MGTREVGEGCLSGLSTWLLFKLPRTAVAPWPTWTHSADGAGNGQSPENSLSTVGFPFFPLPTHLPPLITPSRPSASCSLKSPPLLPVQARLSPALPDVAYPYNGILSRLHAADTEVRTRGTQALQQSHCSENPHTAAITQHSQK